MIDHAQIKQVLYSQFDQPSDQLVSAVFTGLVAGIALSIKDPMLAAQAERNLRTEWTVGLTSPGGPYSPGIMADALIKALGPHRDDDPLAPSEEEGGSGSGLFKP